MEQPVANSHYDDTSGVKGLAVTDGVVEFDADVIEDADFQAVAVPAQQVILPQNPSRGDAIAHLSRGIPQNEFGLPVYFLRSDLLALDHMCAMGYTTQDEVDCAAELLHYTDGYPTFGQGTPFWIKMPHEPQPSYVLFQRYLELAEEEGIRLIDSVARREMVDLEMVRNTYQEFYWSARARAYDLFITAAEAKRREALTRKSERSHYEAAGGILNKVIERFNKEPELIDDMSATDLMDLFEQMVKIQRLSLGLTGQNASTVNKDMQPASSTEVIFRNLVKGAGGSEQTVDTIQNRLALIMQDPDTAMAAQEMIIRTTTGNVVNSQNV